MLNALFFVSVHPIFSDKTFKMSTIKVCSTAYLSVRTE